jgi:hypothetical protein
MSAIYRSGGLTQGVQSHMVALMADQLLAGAVQPLRSRIQNVIVFRPLSVPKISFPTQTGTGQKAKERLSGDEPMRAADCIINGCRLIQI